ncbi:rCG59609, partial [Rattus norvegicus]
WSSSELLETLKPQGKCSKGVKTLKERGHKSRSQD